MSYISDGWLPLTEVEQQLQDLHFRELSAGGRLRGPISLDVPIGLGSAVEVGHAPTTNTTSRPIASATDGTPPAIRPAEAADRIHAYMETEVRFDNADADRDAVQASEPALAAQGPASTEEVQASERLLAAQGPALTEDNVTAHPDPSAGTRTILHRRSMGAVWVDFCRRCQRPGATSVMVVLLGVGTVLATAGIIAAAFRRRDVGGPQRA